MEQLFELWILAIIVTAFISNKYSICLYLAYFILVPVLNVSVAGFFLKSNMINGIALVGFLFNYGKMYKTFDYSPFRPFFYLFVFYLLLIPIQSGTPFFFSINEWRADFMSIFFIPFMMWNHYKMNPSTYYLFRNTLITCIIIVMLYGLFLTTMPGVNPYLMLVLPLGDSSFNEKYAFSDDGRVFGRISSVFIHPMSFGLFIGLATVYFCVIKNEIKWHLGYLFTLICGVNAVTCGVRSVIGALMLVGIYYLYCRRKIKDLFVTVLSLFMFFQVMTLIPGMSDYLSSISIGSKSRNVSGSSMSLRLDQLVGSLEEVSDCPLQGKGYAWSAFYQTKQGDHPVILAFESLAYVVICNYGFLGVIAWILFVYKVMHRYKSKDQHLYMNAIFLVYLAYSGITGEYAYMKYMMIFYVILLMYFRHQNYQLNHS